MNRTIAIIKRAPLSALCAALFCISVAPLYAQSMYWENAVRITEGDARFPRVVTNGKKTWVFWEEIDTKNETIGLSCRYTDTDGTVRTNRRFAGPFPYSGRIPDIYSAAVSKRGTVAVAVLSGKRTISIFTSSDDGAYFTEVKIPHYDESFVAPQIYATSRGTFMLFVSLGQNASFAMYAAASPDGFAWSEFSHFLPADSQVNPFIPVLNSMPKSDVVVFQAQYILENRISYQLYATFSSDAGVTWSMPLLITGASSLAPDDKRDFSAYHNQRPFLFTRSGVTYIAWERTYYASENSHIWVGQLTKEGIVAGTAKQISGEGNANRAVLFSFNNTLSAVWFDTRIGIETVRMAQKKGPLWEEITLSSGRVPSLFAFPVITRSKSNVERLAFVWQENPQNGKPGIYLLEPDISVAPPSIKPLSFETGKRAKERRVRFRIELPSDSSGVAGYSWSWSQDKSTEPPDTIMNVSKERTVEVNASAEGKWYFKVRTADYAGNRSDSAVAEYYLDLTAPAKPSIKLPETDKAGFIDSNSFDISWQPDAADSDIAGYTWHLQYIAPIDDRLVYTKRRTMRVSVDEAKAMAASFLTSRADDIRHAEKPPKRILGKERRTSYANRKNGLYVFSVAAVDDVGNIGEASAVPLLLNKYVPVTYITSVASSSDMFGNLTIDIIGGGFTYDGTVNEIYIDKDGKAPYDLTLRRSEGTFRVVSDNRIVDIRTGTALDEGAYHIGLVHSDRGLFMSGVLFRVEKKGTVKMERQYAYGSPWQPIKTASPYHIQIGTLLFWIVIALAAAGFAFALFGLTETVRDTLAVRMEIRALIAGDSMPQRKKKRFMQLKYKGISLRFKLMLFTTLLVIVTVVLVALPFGINMVRTQQSTLARGLSERVDMLLESLSSSTRVYMSTQNILEMNYLPDQMSSLEEARYVTITGYPSNNANTGLGYVWATNDPEILQKISNSTLTYGVSEITNETVREIARRCEKLNDAAAKEVGGIAADIAELNAEGISLALRTDERSVERREEIARITTELSTKLTVSLNELAAKGSGSVPSYDYNHFDRVNTDYLFYRPVLYRYGTSQEYVRGIVFMRVSTENIVAAIYNARRSVFLTALFIALFAVLIGAAGSFILASIIVAPIRELARHVQIIGETADKMKLAGHDIKIKGHDEIGQLGESVNEMTHGLVRAAKDERLLMDGRVVQQTFLPLVTGEDGAKGTFAKLDEVNLRCFGYYEGATGVSGDYFDYKKLDDRWYVLIKCDASGHGVPAALLMTIVATLFRTYFANWSYERNGTQIDTVVSQINDFIESLGIKGKFAAIIICLFDTVSGDVYMCNAGDNIVHIYDNMARKETELTLFETPAAGPLPSSLVNMKGGFKVEKTHLQKGDVLFLYTDGIEEATRKFRSPSFDVIRCAEKGLHPGDVHGNHKVGEDSEQLESSRVGEIIEAVFARNVYTLKKFHNPIPDEELVFDFSTCKGTIEEAVIALVSVEKVFRMYKSPDVTAADVVRVDKKIDEFLEKHFNRYNYYCGVKQESAEGTNYFEYAYLREDEQLDDLTLLAVLRP